VSAIALGLVAVLGATFALGGLLRLWSLPGAGSAGAGAAPGIALPEAGTEALAQEGMTPVGTSPAPAFTLVDQSGQSVSLKGLRGRVVVLTFLDPVCWYECTLQALDMKLMLSYLPADLRGRVALVAVAANPVVHSVAAVESFSEDQGMNALPSWYFLTSPAWPVLHSVWKAYGVSVPVPSYQMAEHPEIFEFIDPRGRLRYVMGPTDTPAAFVGTAEVLAGYAAHLLGGRATFAGAPSGQRLLQAAPFRQGMTKGPETLGTTMVGAETGWRMRWQEPLGEYVLETTKDGGRTWAEAPFTGIDAHGGMLAAYGAGGQAWLVVLPYGYDLAPATFYTADFGRHWQFTGTLPQRALPLGATRRAILAAAAASLVAVRGDSAYVLGGDAVWAAVGAGGWQRLASLPAGLGRAERLRVSASGLSITGSAGVFDWQPGQGWTRAS